MDKKSTIDFCVKDRDPYCPKCKAQPVPYLCPEDDEWYWVCGSRKDPCDSPKVEHPDQRFINMTGDTYLLWQIRRSLDTLVKLSTRKRQVFFDEEGKLYQG